MPEDVRRGQSGAGKHDKELTYEPKANVLLARSQPPQQAAHTHAPAGRSPGVGPWSGGADLRLAAPRLPAPSRSDRPPPVIITVLSLAVACVLSITFGRWLSNRLHGLA